MIKRILVKILSTEVPRKAKNGMVVRCHVKDENDDKGTLNAWDDLMPEYVNSFEVDKILDIKNIKVHNYPVGKPHQLKTMAKQTIIKDVTEEKKENFQNIVSGDELISGKIECIHTVHTYRSCTGCRSSVGQQVTGTCNKCKTPIRDPKLDFVFETYIIINGNDEDIRNYVGFRRSLPNLQDDLPIDETELETILNEKYSGKNLEIKVSERKDKPYPYIDNLKIKD